MHIGFAELSIILLFGLFGAALWAWALVECLTKEADTGNNKIAWAIVIVAANFIGAILYLLVRRPRRMEELGR